MFIEVDEKELVVGKKYAILAHYNLVHYSTGTFNFREGMCVHHFHYLKQLHLFSFYLV